MNLVYEDIPLKREASFGEVSWRGGPLYIQVPVERSVEEEAVTGHVSPGTQGHPFGRAILRPPDHIASGVMLCAPPPIHTERDSGKRMC